MATELDLKWFTLNLQPNLNQIIKQVEMHSIRKRNGILAQGISQCLQSPAMQPMRKNGTKTILSSPQDLKIHGQWVLDTNGLDIHFWEGPSAHGTGKPTQLI